MRVVEKKEFSFVVRCACVFHRKPTRKADTPLYPPPPPIMTLCDVLFRRMNRYPLLMTPWIPIVLCTCPQSTIIPFPPRCVSWFRGISFSTGRGSNPYSKRSAECSQCSSSLFSSLSDVHVSYEVDNWPAFSLDINQFTRADWKVHGMVAVRRCYVEGGADCWCQVVVVG
jgi:hypothetical protein